MAFGPEPEDDSEDVGPQDVEHLGLSKFERDYLIPATDQHHISVRLQCRVPPAIARLIADVHQSKRYPFKLQGDLIRWAVVRGTYRLAQGRGVNSVMMRGETIRQLLIDEDYHLEFQQNFSALSGVITKHAAAGSLHKARELLMKVKAQIEQMPANEWREKYVAEFYKLFATTMDGDVPVILGAGVLVGVTEE